MGQSAATEVGLNGGLCKFFVHQFENSFHLLLSNPFSGTGHFIEKVLLKPREFSF